MHVLIIEDEIPAAKRLRALLHAADPGIEVLAVLDSVEESTAWLASHPQPDLVFMDIHLADGLSFAIFDAVAVQAPVIFTTAYDQYALKAFTVNSLDYLLKPVDPADLGRALGKYRHYSQRFPPVDVQALLRAMQPPRYQQRFLLKIGDQYKYLAAAEIAYCLSEDGCVWIYSQEGRKLPCDLTVEALEQQLDPEAFFRISRKCILRHSAIHRIHSWFNSRLKLELKPEGHPEILVSRDRVADFKHWLNA